MRTGTLHVLFGFFCALFVASQANIIAQAGPVAADVLRLQFTGSPETFRQILDGWSAEELARYRSHFAWDSIHPLIYGTLFGLWTLVVHRQRTLSSRALRLFLILAIAPSVLDYVENAFHLYLEVNRESITSGALMVATGTATLKWLCAAVVCALLLVTSLRALSGRPAMAATSGAASARFGMSGAGTGKTAGVKSGARKTGGEVAPAQRTTGKPATKPGTASAANLTMDPVGGAGTPVPTPDGDTGAGTKATEAKATETKASSRKRSGSRRNADS